MKIFKLVCSILTLSLLLFCKSTFADFNVRGGEEYQSKYPYGNAETIRFNRAVNGQPLTPGEEAALESKLPLKESGSYYGRVCGNFSTITLDRLKNTSKGNTSSGLINVKRVSKGQIGIELAVGYIWSRTFRGDIEYLVNRNLTYSANPVFTGPGIAPRSLQSEVKNNTILLNAYYDFEGYDRFRPFVTGGLGVSSNSASTTLNPPTTDSGSGTNRAYGLTLSLGAGFRVAIFQRWFINVSYRYINLGPVMIRPNSTVRINGNLSMSVPSVGFIYLF